jgi:ribose/xylose/arabinose/galactoside ABC-type transport system permease subunit
VKVIAYALVGAVVGLAAVMQAGRLGSVAQCRLRLELLAVAAVLLGGTSLYGAEAASWEPPWRCCSWRPSTNGLRISGVSSFWEDVVTGTI